MKTNEVTGTVEVRKGQAHLITEEGTLLLLPFPDAAPLDPKEMAATGAKYFAELHNEKATILGQRDQDRLFDARVKPKIKPVKDVPLEPRSSHDDIALRIVKFFPDSEAVARRLVELGILTASAFYHRLKDDPREVKVFSDYLEVSQSAIRAFLKSMETDRATAALVKTPPRIPVTRGIDLSRIAAISKERKSKAPRRPPSFPLSQATPELPSRVDLSEDVTAVRDQGPSRGTCVAYTAAAMLEHALIRQGSFNRRLDLSEQHLYWACKQLDGAAEDEGSFLEYAMQALRDGVPDSPMPAAGTCKERFWRYSTASIAGNEAQGPPPPAALKAPLYPITKARRLDESSIRDLKFALASGRCVGLSVYTYHFWTDGYAWREGRISLPIVLQPDGAHAICLVGYDDLDDTHGDGAFLFKNSWGKNWGVQRRDQGYGLLPYRYILEEAIEAWAIDV